MPVPVALVIGGEAKRGAEAKRERRAGTLLNDTAAEEKAAELRAASPEE